MKPGVLKIKVVKAALKTLTIWSFSSLLISSNNDINYNCKVVLDKLKPELYERKTATQKSILKFYFTSDLTLEIINKAFTFDSQIDKLDINYI